MQYIIHSYMICKRMYIDIVYIYIPSIIHKLRYVMGGYGRYQAELVSQPSIQVAKEGVACQVRGLGNIRYFRYILTIWGSRPQFRATRGLRSVKEGARIDLRIYRKSARSPETQCETGCAGSFWVSCRRLSLPCTPCFAMPLSPSPAAEKESKCQAPA